MLRRHAPARALLERGVADVAKRRGHRREPRGGVVERRVRLAEREAHEARLLLKLARRRVAAAPRGRGHRLAARGREEGRARDRGDAVLDLAPTTRRRQLEDSGVGSTGVIAISGVGVTVHLVGLTLRGADGTAAISVDGGASVTMHGCNISDGTGPAAALVVSGDGTTVAVSHSALSRNYNTAGAGGAAAVSGGGRLLMESSVLVANRAENGGALAVSGAGSELWLSSCSAASKALCSSSEIEVVMPGAFGAGAGALEEAEAVAERSSESVCRPTACTCSIASVALDQVDVSAGSNDQ